MELTCPFSSLRNSTIPLTELQQKRAPTQIGKGFSMYRIQKQGENLWYTYYSFVFILHNKKTI